MSLDVACGTLGAYAGEPTGGAEAAPGPASAPGPCRLGAERIGAGPPIPGGFSGPAGGRSDGGEAGEKDLLEGELLEGELLPEEESLEEEFPITGAAG